MNHLLLVRILKFFGYGFFLVPLLSYADEVTQSEFDEAMLVCDNMTLYVQTAQRQSAMGLALADAKSLAVASMEKNLKFGQPLKTNTIRLATEIYDYVYGAEGGKTASVETVLISTCGKFAGRTISADRVAGHVSATAQSAWDPLVRVPLCTKLAQSAANLGTARDKGVPRDRINEIASKALANDAFTSAHLPELIATVYDNIDVQVDQFYGYFLARCRSIQANRSFPELQVMKPEISKCAGGEDRDRRATCYRRLFGLGQEPI